MSFEDIIGHERAVQVLQRALARGTIGHAYLFSGEGGIGKRMTARALAAAVNCRARGDRGGCGTCSSCRRTAGESHPDVHLLVPDGTDIKIEQVRQAQADLALRPFEGEKKVLIVDEADALNEAAANALLKTLEEPPGDALIVLVSAMPHKLLLTIRSRCQEIRFQPLSRRSLARVLAEKRALSDEDAWFLSAIARGSVGRGLQMDVVSERNVRDEFARLVSGLPGMSADEVLSLADAVAKERERFDRMIDIGVERMRDLAVALETGDEQLLVYPAACRGIRPAPGDRTVVPRVLAAVERLLWSRRLLEGRVSGQLVAENLLFGMQRDALRFGEEQAA